MKKGKIGIFIIFLVLIVLIATCIIFIPSSESGELIAIRSDEELKEFYHGDKEDELPLGKMLLTAPWSFMYLLDSPGYYYQNGSFDSITNVESNVGGSINSLVPQASTTTGSSSSSKDYSTTNIQVENVDEADIIKTDGDYIYSISENNVVISDVRDAQNVKVVSKISLDSSIPEELILNDNILVVISAASNNSNSWNYKYNSNTVVTIYDISKRETPTKIKSYTLYAPYYTSRCIENKLYVISYGRLRYSNNQVDRYYTENYGTKEIALENIKYLKDIYTSNQTLLSMVDLKNPYADVTVNSYLIDIENAYVSEKSIYLLDAKYDYDEEMPSPFIIFGLKGIFEIKDYFEDNYDYSYEETTSIYKFNILNNGTIEYACKGEAKGETINQYSVDEYKGYLRLALSDSDGSRIVVLDNNLNEVGKTPDLARGEKMYSSRFIGNRAYLVTYQTIDPLFAIDLTYPTHPTVLGELKIPGYSTYLHPYDENHLIGIGMETKEHINRDYEGNVISTSASVVGMKMALFDVSNISNPKQISSTVIGDSRTTSAILTNAKALLFSKEKNLIAIPVNNYSYDFKISDTTNMSTLVNSYVNNTKSYVSEGYLVYDINVEDGFNLKGTITHDLINKNYSTRTKLLRGLYIEDKLYTVSESMIKVNNLSDLNLISETKIIEGGI